MGKHKNFHIGVKALITNSEGKILLFQINPAKRKDNKIEKYWDIPGGRIENGDTVDVTLKKELKEEANIINIVDYVFFHATISNFDLPTDQGPVGLALFIFTVNVPSDVQVKLSDEHIAMRWCDPKEASDLLQTKYPDDFTAKIRSL